MPKNWDHYEPTFTVMTADDWLSLFKNSVLFETDSATGKTYGRSTTLWEYEDFTLADFPNYTQCRDNLQLNFAMSIPKNRWDELTENGEVTTIGEICDLLAECGGTRVVVRPETIAGHTCRAAGAFLALRKVMQQEGCDVGQVAPSTTIGNLNRDQLNALLGGVERTQPAVLNRIDLPMRGGERLTIYFWIAILIALSMIFYPWSTAVIGFLTLLWLGSWITTARFCKGQFINKDSTLRDLCALL